MTAPVRGFPQQKYVSRRIKQSAINIAEVYSMFATPQEAKRLANARAIAVYPGTDLEILGYTTENGQSFAFIRRGGSSGRISKVSVRYNGHCEPYCSLSINGYRQHVYLNDCTRVMQ